MCSILSVGLLQQRQREVVGQRGAAGQQAAAARRQPVVHRHLAPRAEHPEPEPARAARQCRECVGALSVVQGSCTHRKTPLYRVRKLCGGATRASSRGVSASAAAAQHTCGSPASPAHTLHLRHHARHYPLPATRYALPATRYPHPAPPTPLTWPRTARQPRAPCPRWTVPRPRRCRRETEAGNIFPEIVNVSCRRLDCSTIT